MHFLRKFKPNLLVVFVLLCSLSAKAVRAVEPPEVDKGKVISQIQRTAWKQLTGVTTNPQVTENGLRFEVRTREGLFNNIQLGVFPGVATAEAYWNSVEKPLNSEKVEMKTDSRVRAWKLEGDETYHIVLGRFNVITQFDWRGTQQEATDFINKLDGALQNDRNLAPLASEVIAPEVQATLPAVVAVGQEFPVLFESRATQTTEQTQLVSLASQSQIRANDKTTQVELLPSPLMVQNGQSKAQINQPGEYQLTTHFVTYGGVVLSQTNSVKVLDSQELPWKNNRSWDLPDKAVYLLPNEKTKWADVPAERQEQIRLTHATLSALPKEEVDGVRLRAWNQLASVL